jgi:hypothetical protein
MICCHVVAVGRQDLGSRKAKTSRFFVGVDEERKNRVKTYVASIKKVVRGKAKLARAPLLSKVLKII